MPEYQEILDTEVEPEAPLTSSLGVRFRDNPLAVWEGAPSAPRIQLGAIASNAVTTDNLRSPEAGQSFLIMRLQESAFSTGSQNFLATEANNRARNERHLGVTVLVPGVITCYLQHRLVFGDASSEVRVIKNGSQVQSWSTSSTSFQTRSVDVSVDLGDSVVFQQRRTGDSGRSSFRRLRIYSANPDMAVA